MKANQYIKNAKKTIKKIKTIKMEFIVSIKNKQKCVSGFID